MKIVRTEDIVAAEREICFASSFDTPSHHQSTKVFERGLNPYISLKSSLQLNPNDLRTTCLLICIKYMCKHGAKNNNNM